MLILPKLVKIKRKIKQKICFFGPKYFIVWSLLKFHPPFFIFLSYRASISTHYVDLSRVDWIYIKSYFQFNEIFWIFFIYWMVNFTYMNSMVSIPSIRSKIEKLISKWNVQDTIFFILRHKSEFNLLSIIKAIEKEIIFNLRLYKFWPE